LILVSPQKTAAKKKDMQAESLDSLFIGLVDAMMVTSIKAQVGLFIGNNAFCPFFLGTQCFAREDVNGF
jgi:hypothetical protein